MHALISDQSSSILSQPHTSSPSHSLSYEHSDLNNKILNYSQVIDQNFETCLKDLHEFVQDLFQVDGSPLVYMSDGENPDFNSRSSHLDDLRLSIADVVSSLEKRLREHQFYRLFTTTELNQSFRTIKHQIANIFNHRLKNISADTNTDSQEENENGGTLRKDFAKPSKSRMSFSKRSQIVLKAWLKNHLSDPYPSPQEKEELAAEAGITPRQVQIWFSNKRTRMKNKKPKKASFSKQVQEKFLKDQR